MKNPDVQAASIEALNLIAESEPNTIPKIAKQNVIPKTLKSMEEFHQHKEVVKSSVGLLKTMASDPDSSELIVKHDGITAIIKSMKRNPNSK